MVPGQPSNDPRREQPDDRTEPRDPKAKADDRPRKRKTPRRPGLVIGPTTDDADVQLEW
jgi:hypothetical protein